MKKLFSILLGTALAGTAMGMDMKVMDTNKDGMISKQEFTKHHEAMWEKMKKDKMGMVDVKEMEKMHGEMMKGDKKMMKDDKMMKGDGMKDSMKK